MNSLSCYCLNLNSHVLLNSKIVSADIIHSAVILRKIQRKKVNLFKKNFKRKEGGVKSVLPGKNLLSFAKFFWSVYPIHCFTRGSVHPNVLVFSN